jgi:hypothetical protein
MKLTEKRRHILVTLAAQPTPLTAYQLACACGERRNPSDWAHRPLREMEKDGLVQAVGIGRDSSKAWEATPSGRAAIAVPA